MRTKANTERGKRRNGRTRSPARSIFTMLLFALVAVACNDEAITNPDLPEPPEPPTSLLAMVDGTTMTVRWDAVVGADSYRVILTAPDEPIREREVSDATVTFEGLNSGMTYVAVVWAINDAGETRSEVAVSGTIGAGS